jgi:hypothetical protein
MAQVSEVSPSELKEFIEFQYGGTAYYVQSVPVHEEHSGQTVWSGTVAVFDLTHYPKANRAYAWSREVEGGERQFYSVLHAPPITGPRDAVRTAIAKREG